MKLVHLSDLHLGKRVHETSMLADQRYILDEILNIVRQERPDAVLLAGDIYDKAVPSAEAVQLFDRFLWELSQTGAETFVISGNHDSPERIAFGGRLMDRSGIHLSPVYEGTVEPVTLHDAFGPVDVYMLPFLKPALVRRWYPEAEIETYTDAVRTALEHLEGDPSHRKVLLTHQFVTGASRSESEEISVGGSDNVDASVFDGFDYVALGHIHGPQNIGSERIRYCGTPLKYSFSEARQEKSVTVAELGEKESLTVRTVPLKPLRDMREIRGTYLEVSALDFYRGTAVDDYLRIILTDEEEVPDAAQKLRSIYPNLLRLEYDNTRTRAGGQWEEAEDVEQRSPLELFGDFYEQLNGSPMSEAQSQLVERLIAETWRDEG